MTVSFFIKHETINDAILYKQLRSLNRNWQISSSLYISKDVEHFNGCRRSLVFNGLIPKTTKLHWEFKHK